MTDTTEEATATPGECPSMAYIIVNGVKTRGLVKCMLAAGHDGQHVEHLRWDEVTPVELVEAYDAEEPTDVEVGLDVPADFEPPSLATPPCPECIAGKHRNCGGDSWNIYLDEPKPCPCWLDDPAGHRAVELYAPAPPELCGALAEDGRGATGSCVYVKGHLVARHSWGF